MNIKSLVLATPLLFGTVAVVAHAEDKASHPVNPLKAHPMLEDALDAADARCTQSPSLFQSLQVTLGLTAVRKSDIITCQHLEIEQIESGLMHEMYHDKAIASDRAFRVLATAVDQKTPDTQLLWSELENNTRQSAPLFDSTIYSDYETLESHTTRTQQE